MFSKSNIPIHLRDHAFTLAWLVVALLARNYLVSKDLNLPSHPNRQFVAATGAASATLSLDR
jgi:hypothetical protein